MHFLLVRIDLLAVALTAVWTCGFDGGGADVADVPPPLPNRGSSAPVSSSSPLCHVPCAESSTGACCGDGEACYFNQTGSLDCCGSGRAICRVPGSVLGLCCASGQSCDSATGECR